MVVSPPYPCQLVFDAKLTAVLNDESGETPAKSCGLSGQVRLQALQREHDDETDEVDREHRQRVTTPVGLLGRIDARETIDQALDGPDDGREERSFTFEDPRHVGAQRLDQCHEHQQVHADLQQARAGHWNRSG